MLVFLKPVPTKQEISFWASWNLSAWLFPFTRLLPKFHFEQHSYISAEGK